MKKLFTIRNLSKKFYGETKPIKVLGKVNLEINKGDFTVILGPSGCGKTTLFNIIAGLIQPTSGKIVFYDSQPKFGFVFQEPRLFPWLRVIDNVSFGLNLTSKSSENLSRKVKKYLNLVGLKKKFDSYFPYQLSGGMKQRVALARTLVTEPKVILMDEPFNSLDIRTRSNLQKLLLELSKKLNLTILFITHDIEEAIFLGDKLYLLSGLPGRILKQIELPKDKKRNSLAIKNKITKLMKML